jgi:hypothetical protein
MEKFAKSFVLFVICLCQFSITNAQLLNNPTGLGNNYSYTDPFSYIESIGLGDFPIFGFSPRAALNINTNLLNGVNTLPPSYGNFGEVFRTDAPDRDDLGDIYSF